MSEKYYTEHDANVNEDCAIAHSDLCYWLSGRVSCAQCYVGTLKTKEQKEEARDRWAATIALLPGDVDRMHEEDACPFCRENPREKTGYAFLEMANPEPYFEKGMFFGFGKKVRTPVGSLVTLQAGVCDRCRKALRLPDIIQVGSLVAGVVVGILLLLLPGYAQKMTELFVLLPVIFLALTSVAGFYIGKSASAAFMRRQAKDVKVDPSEIPVIALMLQKKWFFFQTNNGVPRISFSGHKQFDRIVRQAEQKTAQEDGDELPLDNMNI